MPLNAREVALKVLSSYRRRGAWAGDALASIITEGELSKRDGALASTIVLGVLQNITLLDFYLSSYLTCNSDKLEPLVSDILRLSAYQLVFLNRVPAHAAVSEGVKLAKKHANPRAASLVNAVLRKIAANLATLPPLPEKNMVEHLAIRYSHPKWLVKELINTIGYDGAQEYLKEDNSTVPVTVQVNSLRYRQDEVILRLSEDGCMPEKHPWLENALILPSPGNFLLTSAFSDGLFYVQDVAARLAVTASSVKPGMTVIDGCASPGGKSFAAAVDMNNRGRIISCDLNVKKLLRIAEGAERLGISIIKTRKQDAKTPDDQLKAAADVVFADVPCSGLGVIRKKPEIRWKNPDEFSELPDIQLGILRGLSSCLKPGGILIYSTCTVLKSENEGVCHRFLAENKDFIAEPFELPAPLSFQESGMLTLWPHLHGTDGFFICRLKRIK